MRQCGPLDFISVRRANTVQYRFVELCKQAYLRIRIDQLTSTDSIGPFAPEQLRGTFRRMCHLHLIYSYKVLDCGVPIPMRGFQKVSVAQVCRAQGQKCEEADFGESSGHLVSGSSGMTYLKLSAKIQTFRPANVETFLRFSC